LFSVGTDVSAVLSNGITIALACIGLG